MMNEKLRVAAVVVTYNRLPLLQQCLQALAAQSAHLEAIWVIDNASTGNASGKSGIQKYR